MRKKIVESECSVVTRKDVRCSRHANVGRMNVRLNGEPLEAVDRFNLVPGS